MEQRAQTGRILPRLSASQAINNIRDIKSDRSQEHKYRHVSHADFHLGQNARQQRRKITSFNGNNEDNSHLVSSEHDIGFETLNTTNTACVMSDRVNTKNQVNMCTEVDVIGKLSGGFKKGEMTTQRKDEAGQTTTMRSHKSASAVSRRTQQSIRSLRNSQRQSRASNMQTNEMYVVGSLDTININYIVDTESKVVRRKPML